MDFEYTVAEDFNGAWLNFELDLPLKPGPFGVANPFYVDRPGNPLAELEDALLAPYFSSALFYSKEFEAIRDRAIFLPNVKLHPRQRSAECSEEGFTVLRSFVHKRMSPTLFAPEVLDEAIKNSGGVFRELGRIIRSSIGRARRRKASQVEQTDVAWAVAEIRNEYRRILDEADRQFLRQAHQRNVLESHERLRPLLQLLALLEYRNAENWCDVHPALEPLLEEESYGNNQTA